MQSLMPNGVSGINGTHGATVDVCRFTSSSSSCITSSTEIPVEKQSGLFCCVTEIPVGKLRLFCFGVSQCDNRFDLTHNRGGKLQCNSLSLSAVTDTV